MFFIHISYHKWSRNIQYTSLYKLKFVLLDSNTYFHLAGFVGRRRLIGFLLCNFAYCLQQVNMSLWLIIMWQVRQLSWELRWIAFRKVLFVIHYIFITTATPHFSISISNPLLCDLHDRIVNEFHYSKESDWNKKLLHWKFLSGKYLDFKGMTLEEEVGDSHQDIFKT